MTYAYYPGCSLTESAVEYDVSTRVVLEKLGATLEEIPDWTCCGASAVEGVSRLLSFTLPARNLALAEKELPEAKGVLAPCSACYLNLLRVEKEVHKDRQLRDDVNEVLALDELSYAGLHPVRHLLDVLINDIGTEAFAEQVKRPLEGVTLAPYYGCQILRPYHVFDDPQVPRTMEPLFQAMGATTHDWDMGARCCGASLMATKPEVALVSVAELLKAAEGADAIVTVCPMCQMNLDAYQAKARKLGGVDKPISVLYLPQVMGLAMGMDQKEMLLHKNLLITGAFLSRLKERTEATA